MNQRKNQFDSRWVVLFAFFLIISAMIAFCALPAPPTETETPTAAAPTATLTSVATARATDVPEATATEVIGTTVPTETEAPTDPPAPTDMPTLEGYVVVTVKSGDTVSQLALEHLGRATPKFYLGICEFNEIDNCNKIYIKQEIKIPATLGE